MMTAVLQNNGLDGTFQKEVLGSLRSGRAKQRNLCLLGDGDAGKSFLLKGLRGFFQVYTRPEGGNYYQLVDLLDRILCFCWKLI